LKAVILAGGLGTRISEESHLRPKPMIEIGGKPILWHIMKIYSRYGINDFVICLGYRGYVVKEYFANYFLHMSDVSFDMRENRMEVHEKYAEPWRVTLVETGQETLTGGRLLRVRKYLDNEPFCFTYGDGVADIDIQRLVDTHVAGGRVATLTAIQPPGRYGAVVVDGSEVSSFSEKPAGDGAWINGGFFVVDPAVLSHIDGDQSSWESDTLTKLAAMGGLSAYRHSGFWQAMDTLRDKNHLEQLWQSGAAPWKVWA
jgi:glucose-1-phosphate cytidylyltransferase